MWKFFSFPQGMRHVSSLTRSFVSAAEDWDQTFVETCSGVFVDVTVSELM